MFNRHKYDLGMIDQTSRMSLKVSCLKACSNDVEQAKKLYDFLSADITEMPDLDPVVPSTFEQVKRGAEELFGWVTSHKDDIAQGVSLVQSMRKPATGSPLPNGIPPIPDL